MAKRPAKPADANWLCPYLTVRDADRAIEFYEKAFGFQKKLALTRPDGKTGHVEMTWHDCMIMFGPENPMHEHKAPATSGAPVSVAMYAYCDDVDALYARAVAAGAVSNEPPTDKFYGDRNCSVTDPDGHLWYWSTNVADFDPSKVPK